MRARLGVVAAWKHRLLADRWRRRQERRGSIQPTGTITMATAATTTSRGAPIEAAALEVQHFHGGRLDGRSYRERLDIPPDARPGEWSIEIPHGMDLPAAIIWGYAVPARTWGRPLQSSAEVLRYCNGAEPGHWDHVPYRG